MFNISKQADVFSQQATKYRNQLIEGKETTAQKVRDGYMSPEARDQMLQEMESALKTYQREEKDRLTERLDYVCTAELKKIEQTFEGVTADDVAELELLEKTKITAIDLEQMQKRFKNKPVALSRLNAIATERNMPTVVTSPKVEHLKEYHQRMKRYISDTAHFTADDTMAKAVNGMKEHKDGSRILEIYRNPDMIA